jgi:hypothetical protein
MNFPLLIKKKKDCRKPHGQFSLDVYSFMDGILILMSFTELFFKKWDYFGKIKRITYSWDK